MYGMNVFSLLNKSFAVKVRTLVSPLKYIRRNTSNKISYSLRSQVDKDVVIFSFENPKFFIAINIFSAIQCWFWSYLGLFLFKSLEKSTLDVENKKKFWGKVFEVERKYSNTLSAISIIFGWTCFVATCFYSLRSIRKIILHKGGRDVTIVTYNLPGFNTIKTPLINMSSFEHRVKAKKYIPIKIKHKYFYYLIDIRGDFSNPTLFDFTAGMKRSFYRK